MKLSVFVVTYNQEKYIRQCLDSILMQKVDFDYEVVIGEDNGTDGTRAICEEYAEKYPQIKLLPLIDNLGYFMNWKRVLANCEGEYIAMCEGDDYWIDPNKLQKQADFLDNHLEVGLVFTQNLILETSGNFRNDYVIYKRQIPEVFDFHYLLKKNYFPQTVTVCFKSECLSEYYLKSTKLVSDTALFTVIAEHHLLGFIDTPTGVWREGVGVTSRMNAIFAAKEYTGILKECDKYTKGTYTYKFGKAARCRILYQAYRVERKYYPIAYYYYLVWQISEKGFNRKNIFIILKNTFRKFRKIKHLCH